METCAKVQCDNFGKTKDGKAVKIFTCTNDNYMTVRIITYGAIVKDIIVPDRHGDTVDVNLGFDDIAAYEERNTPYMGAICGRFTNRIAGARYTLDDKEYQLAKNDGPNHLHGGIKGFDKVVWDGEIVGNKIQLTYVSADGEENYPGELTTTVTYELTNDNALIIDYTATTTKATPINLTNHCYFNLEGQGSKNLDDCILTINAERHIAQDSAFLPTGELPSVEGTLYDFRKPVRLGDRLSHMDNGIGLAMGYCIGETGVMKKCARLEHPPSGRVMEVSTTEPGLVGYSSYFLDDVTGKGESVYRQFSAICLETEHYPDSVNHDHFPSTILRPGNTYRHTSIYKFSTIS